MMEELLSSDLKVKVASFLCPRDAFRWSKTSSNIFHDLSLAQLPMKIPYHSWYEQEEQQEREQQQQQRSLRRGDMQLKRGPRIPFLAQRTHSVTLTGSWNCRFGEIPIMNTNDSQIYIVAYSKSNVNNINDDNNRSNMRIASRSSGHYEKKKANGGGNKKRKSRWNDIGLQEEQQHRIVWKSKPLLQQKRSSDSAAKKAGWMNLSATFYPRADEEYYLCIRLGPSSSSAFGRVSYSLWWKHSLHMSNLVAHIAYHDNPNTSFMLKRQYKTIVKQMLPQVEEHRAVYYTRILEAVARSIRIQLARSAALDPVLESFFQMTEIPRNSDSLLVLEEIAHFLSVYALVNERRRSTKKSNNYNSNNRRDSMLRKSAAIVAAEEESGNLCDRSNSNSSTSSPDWVPFAETSLSSIACSRRSLLTADDDDYNNENNNNTIPISTTYGFAISHSFNNDDDDDDDNDDNYDNNDVLDNENTQEFSNNRKKGRRPLKKFKQLFQKISFVNKFRRQCRRNVNNKSVRYTTTAAEELQATEEFSILSMTP